MTKTVDLPYLDHTGKLTPLIIEAMKNGATSDHHATDPDKITLSFAKAADADAFAKLVAPILSPAIEQEPAKVTPSDN